MRTCDIRTGVIIVHCDECGAEYTVDPVRPTYDDDGNVTDALYSSSADFCVECDCFVDKSD